MGGSIQRPRLILKRESSSRPAPAPCYNVCMDVGDIRFYVERWKEVEKVEREELRCSTARGNWKRLNAIIRRAIRLKLSRGDDGEMEVFARWAKIKAGK